MMVYNDMSYCAHKECPKTYCVRHQSHVPWDDLPEWMGVSVADFGGKYKHCPADLEPIDFGKVENEDEAD